MSVPDIASRVHEMRLGRYRKFPSHSNRASSLGHDCLRALYYQRTAWQEATDPGDTLKLIFQEGDLHETSVLRDIQEAGFQVIEQQVSLQWDRYQITGHVDAIVVAENSADAGANGASGDIVGYPIDVKSMSGHIWSSCFRDGPRVYEWADVRDQFEGKTWLRKYYGQLVLYMLMKNVDHGALLCKSKQTGELAQVNLPLDFDLGEKLLRRAEFLNTSIDNQTPPDRIQWDEDICGRCEHLVSCLPERVGEEPIKFIEVEEIEQLLKTRELAEEGYTAYQRSDKRMKAWAKAQDGDKLVVGDYLLEVKRGDRQTRIKVTKI